MCSTLFRLQHTKRCAFKFRAGYRENSCRPLYPLRSIVFIHFQLCLFESRPLSPPQGKITRTMFPSGLQNSVSPNLSPVDMASLAAAMRMGNNGDMSGGTQGSTGPQQQGVQASGPEQALRMHQAEALLRSQAEAALRLAVRNPLLSIALVIKHRIRRVRKRFLARAKRRNEGRGA